MKESSLEKKFTDFDESSSFWSGEREEKEMFFTQLSWNIYMRKSQKMQEPRKGNEWKDELISENLLKTWMKRLINEDTKVRTWKRSPDPWTIFRSEGTRSFRYRRGAKVLVVENIGEERRYSTEVRKVQSPTILNREFFPRKTISIPFLILRFVVP